MIQLVALRGDAGKKYHKFYDPPILADSVQDLLERPSDFVSLIPEGERNNVYYVASHSPVGTREFTEQEIIPFDIDDIDITRKEEYIEPVCSALGIDSTEVGVVFSGNGLQFIVGLNEIITNGEFFDKHRKAYKNILTKIKLKLESFGLPGKPDPAVFSTARLLRMPETINIKPGKDSRKAIVLRKNIYPNGFDLGDPETIKPRRDGTYPMPDKSAVLAGCEFLKDMKNNKQTEPEWYAALSILGRLENGHDIALEYSKTHPTFDYFVFSSKLSQSLSASGPRTCDNINSLWGKCESCPNFGKVKSPISLKSKKIEKAVKNDSVFSLYQDLDIDMGKFGPIANVNNVVKFLGGLPNFKEAFWFDEFHQKYFTTLGGEPREWRDVDSINLAIYFQQFLGLKTISDLMIEKAVVSYARSKIKNEPRDWIDSLKWDGIIRVEHFFSDCFGAKDTEYTRAASKNWWVSMAARIYKPGAKVDNMVILEGGQGKFKSTALDIIGGAWYAEVNEQMGSKDFFLTLQGKLIIEISELDSFSKAEVNTIKKVITSRTDRFRPPYGRASVDCPRRCVFVGTTNDEHYLRDHTGGRRFWPVKIGDINIDLIKANREQLFAEACHLLSEGSLWWEMPHKETEFEQESRRQIDPWEEKISEFIDKMMSREEISLSEIANHLDIDTAYLDRSSQMRIAKSLKSLGWICKVKREKDKIVRRYIKMT